MNKRTSQSQAIIGEKRVKKDMAKGRRSEWGRVGNGRRRRKRKRSKRTKKEMGKGTSHTSAPRRKSRKKRTSAS